MSLLTCSRCYREFYEDSLSHTILRGNLVCEYCFDEYRQHGWSINYWKKWYDQQKSYEITRFDDSPPHYIAKKQNWRNVEFTGIPTRRFPRKFGSKRNNTNYPKYGIVTIPVDEKVNPYLPKGSRWRNDEYLAIKPKRDRSAVSGPIYNANRVDRVMDRMTKADLERQYRRNAKRHEFSGVPDYQLKSNEYASI